MGITCGDQNSLINSGDGSPTLKDITKIRPKSFKSLQVWLTRCRRMRGFSLFWLKACPSYCYSNIRLGCIFGHVVNNLNKLEDVTF